MQIKIFDEETEEDLEDLINDFIEDKKVLDIKYSVAILLDGGEQIYCYSSLIMYE